MIRINRVGGRELYSTNKGGGGGNKSRRKRQDPYMTSVSRA